jgi:ubiquinone/menaquinone biosynthesis C-methylase UbiE
MMQATHEYQRLGNRQYVSDLPYLLPKDDQEIDRLDLQHIMLRYLFKGNYLAPIAKPAHILDIGSGTGRWIVEMAEEFPQADLVGVDLKLPEQGAIPFPSNSHFQVGNALDGLPFEDASFDFVHQRLLIFAVPRFSWLPLVKELARVTRRGGWVELVEVNPFIRHIGPSTECIIDLIVQATIQRGLDPDISQHMGALLSAAGLKHVETSARFIPLGKWGGQLGALALADMRAIIQAMKPLVVALTQTSSEEFDCLAAEMEQEFEQYHSTFTFHIAYGQRITSVGQ